MKIRISEKFQPSDFAWNSDVDNNSIHSEELPEILSFATDKKLRYPCFLQPFEDSNDNGNDIIGESESEDENWESDGLNNYESEDENEESEDESESFEDYNAPLFDDDNDFIFNSAETEDFIWIPLFLFKMQTHFKLPAKHIDIFIKFLRIILVDIDNKRF